MPAQASRNLETSGRRPACVGWALAVLAVVTATRYFTAAAQLAAR